MIKESEVFKIGQLGKTHALKGEINFKFDNDVFDRVDCPYLVLRINEILVPFFIEEYRFKNEDTALIIFEDIDSAEKVNKLQGAHVYFPRKYHEEEKEENLEFTWDFFIGFTVIDKQAGDLGTIISIDNQTMNTLFLIENDREEELIIPASEDFMLNIDAKNKILNLQLPEGLIE